MKKQKYVKGRVDDHKESKGWFVGRFMNKYGHPELTVDDIEVCWKTLEDGFEDPLHYHRTGTEIAIMIKGWFKSVVENEVITLKEREYLVVFPHTKLGVVDFEVGSEMVLIKFPSVPDDKYLADED